MNELRQSMMLDTEQASSKRRFGLFSQPPSTAIGDDSPFKQKHARKGEDGKPITLPKNMLAGANRSGVDRKSFLHVPESIYKGDQYLDPEKIDHAYFTKLHSKSTLHQLQFKPSSGVKSQSEYCFVHVDENPLPKIRPAKNDTGRVVTKEKNITTNPMSKVQKELYKQHRYIADPIERKSLMESQERKLGKQKMLPQLFRSMSHGDILFSNDKKVYGLDNRTQELLKKKHEFTCSQPVKVNHESEWIPVRRGHGDPLGKFPEFIPPKPNQIDESPKKMQRQTSQERQLWKHNGNKALSRPTPSISYSSMNLRKYF